MIKALNYIILLILLLSGCAQSPPYKVQYNLTYGPGSSQTYDFYDPKSNTDGPRPALLVIHGGGYVGGDKAWAKKVANEFCPRGYVVVAINYTLAPEGTWPLQLDEAQAALNHMRTSPWMNIREPIAGFGVSAGAHLVAALHLQRDLPLAIGASGPWDLENVSNAALDASIRALLGLPPDIPLTPGDRAVLSATRWVNPKGDMLLIHAKKDTLTVFLHAINFESALRSAGASVLLLAIDDDSHGSAWKYGIWEMDQWLKAKQL